ncbi:hypothetical protein PXO_01634 [Xanthomonas oryzae pv. oryzae PXO99A]|nr:hypothetical protein PXO_01634 [Xanthomonas oryzae pv. oryzae PXO99A]
MTNEHHCTSNQKSKGCGSRSASEANRYYSHATFSEVA